MSLISNSLKIEEKILQENKESEFTFCYFQESVALSVGNFLRRRLLSETSGIAAFGVKISEGNKKNANGLKFFAIEGISETVPYLISEIKNIVFKQKKEINDTFSVKLEVKNNGNETISVKASDFQKSDQVDIVNGELVLFELQPSFSISIELYLKKHYGYHRSEVDQGENLNFKSENIISLDSDYCPVKIVNFSIEKEVTSFNKKEEKLTLKISTNGGRSPKDCLNEILESSRDFFANVKEILNKSEDNK